MALSSEDKADVKGAFGKALANKVSKVTRDHKVAGKKTSDFGRNVAPIFTSAKKADHAMKESSRLGAKSKALQGKRSYSGHYQLNASGALRQLSQKTAERKGLTA